MTGKSFRFQDMEIWLRAARISPQLFQLANTLEEARLYRFAEQLRAATLSITNNIAEGSGSSSRTDFAHYLNMARRSVFEVANVLLLPSGEGYWSEATVNGLLGESQEQSRLLLAFQRSLRIQPEQEPPR